MAFYAHLTPGARPDFLRDVDEVDDDDDDDDDDDHYHDHDHDQF